jgi:ATP-dependent helicase HrpB
LLIEGQRWGQPERVALAAALLSERDPFPRTLDQSPASDTRRSATPSDVLDRVEALEEFERKGRCSSPLGTLHRGAARTILRARNQLARAARHEARLRRAEQEVPRVDADEALLRSLLAAFPDRVARRRETSSLRGVMVGGRGVRLAPSSRVLEPELFLCIDVDASQAETLVRQASGIERGWLPAGQMSVATEVEFEVTTERVIARRRVRFQDLLLDDTQAALPDDQETARVLAAAAVERLDRILPPDDSTAALYLTRVRCLHEWMPELQLPAFADTDLGELVTGLCHGCKSFADLRNASWLAAIHGRLTAVQRQAIERDAPERLLVPSGSRLALRYEVGRPPVLAVRIQEVFGLRDTPRIAGGRVPVLLHLLAPNHRPQQVTDDLASFWTNTYPQVRKELRARYPRHAWPEDPWTASPERRPQRKRSQD